MASGGGDNDDDDDDDDDDDGVVSGFGDTASVVDDADLDGSEFSNDVDVSDNFGSCDADDSGDETKGWAVMGGTFVCMSLAGKLILMEKGKVWQKWWAAIGCSVLAGNLITASCIDIYSFSHSINNSVVHL